MQIINVLAYSTKINLRIEFLFSNLYFNLIFSFRVVQPFIQVYKIEVNICNNQKKISHCAIQNANLWEKNLALNENLGL